MSLNDYIRLLRRNLVLLCACILVALVTTAIVTIVQQPKYQATSSAYVSAAAASNITDLSQGSSYIQQVVRSYADVASQAVVLDPVIERLQLKTDAVALAQQVDANVSVDSVIISVTVTDRSPRTAVDIANAITRQLGETVAVLSPRTTSATAAVKITQTQPATIPKDPSSPRVAVNFLIGLVIGVLGGILISVLRELLDTRIRTDSELTQIARSPIVGRIPLDPTVKDGPLSVTDEARGRTEALKTLRTNLQFLGVDHRAQMVVVTSSISGEGKTTTTANLAATMALTGKKIIAIDADLRRPQLASSFGLDSSVGLTDVLVGHTELSDAIQVVGHSTLSILPAGAIPPNPSELLQSQAMSGMLGRLREQFDYVLLDAPPLLPVTDAAVVARQVDGALLIVAVKGVKKAQVSAARASLESVGAALVGCVFTKVPVNRQNSYYAYSSHSTLTATAQ